MIAFALRRDGTAGVWGVCGEIGLPGDVDEVETLLPTRPGGMLDRRLEKLGGERGMVMEDDKESDPLPESRRRLYLARTIAVRRGTPSKLL